MPKRPKYIKPQRDKFGVVRHYFRYRGRNLGRVPDDFDSAEFHRRYAQLLNSIK